MKNRKLVAVGGAFMFAVQVFAIEGLQISVQCSNVVLSWPSAEGETYVVQYRPTLDPSDSWQTLTSSLPAVSGTNVTTFVHTNIVQNPSGCGDSAFTGMFSGGNTLALAAAEPIAPVLMAIPANGSGGAAPLALYPPGFDLSGFLIFDPLTGESVSGSGYSARALALDSPSFDDPQPLDGGGAADNNVSTPETGFYQVARLGVHIVGLTNFTSGIVSNTIVMPFEVANDTGSVQSVVVIVDGMRYRGADPVVAPNIFGKIAMDTSFLENGNHTVQVQATWLNPDGTDMENFAFTRSSDPFTLSVSNLIYYPDWEDEFGELGFAFYSFKTTFTDVDWQIDIYDVSNNLAKTLTGHTTDGVVETNWNLVDVNGNTRATNDADSEFGSVITVYDAPVSKPTKPKRKPVAYPTQGQWAIAYQDMFGDAVRSNDLWTAIDDFGGIGSQFGGANTVWPTPGHPEYGQTFPIRYAYKLNANPPTSAQEYADSYALVWLITNSVNRNFFYTGHGTEETIAGLTSGEISVFNSRHYYRFVFLNSCSGSKGSLPAAFGINFNSGQPLSYFQKHGIRPRTFVGYNKIVHYAQGGDYIDPATGQHRPDYITDQVLDFIFNFEFYWYYYYDVDWSIYNAVNATPNPLYGWADGLDLDVFGYQGLYINAYNYQSDWSN